MSAARSNKRSSTAISGEIAGVGQAKKTRQGRDSAWKCFRRYEEEGDDDILQEIDEMEDDDAKGELIVSRLVGFCEHMINTPILQQNNTGKVLSEDGCKQYLGSVKEEIKEQTSSLPIWRNHEDEWYSELRNRLGTGKKRGILSGDWDFKDPSSRALPIRAAKSDLRQSERMWAELQGVDLESICKSIIKEDGPNCYRERAKLTLTALAVARGGEVAFLRYDQVWWDDIFLCPEAIWTRLKTVMQQPIYFQGDAHGYLCCIYHVLGCYFAVEDGLLRVDPTKKRENRVAFPDLKGLSTETVATRMTKLIRAHSAPQLKQRNQSRSIRVGSNTTLASHRDVLPEEQRNAGGFKSGSNTDLYTRMNPKLGMTAANALAGHGNARKMVYPPSLDSLVALVDADGLDRLMKNLYTISVPQFEANGTLRPFLQTITAKLIMVHPIMRDDFGSNNKMVRKLLESMIKAKLAVDSADSSRKLDEWSGKIRADYETMNALISDAEDATLRDIVQQQSVLINQLLLSNRNMEARLDHVYTEQAAMRETVESQNTSIVGGLTASLLGALRLARQPSSPVVEETTVAREDSPTVARADSVVDDNTQDEPADADVHVPSPPSTQPSNNSMLQNHPSAGDDSLPELVSTFIANIRTTIQDAEQSGKKDVLQQLSWSEQQGTSIKGVTVKETLLTLVKERRLCSKQKLYDVEPASLDTKNRGHYWACMELVESVLTNEQRQLLQLKQSEQDKVHDYDDLLKITAYTIESAAFVKMKELDGVKASSSRPTIAALGNRYNKYCIANTIPRIKTGAGSTNHSVRPAGQGSMWGFVHKVVDVLSPGRRDQHADV